jgi:hypothetical protein
MVREVDGGNGYASASSLRLHFGLGSATRVERLEIRWPSGLVEHVDPPQVNRALTLEEGRGVVDR